MCVSFNWIFGGFRFLSVNVIWLHLLRFAFIYLFCIHFSIFVICSCSNVTAVSGLVCLTSTAVSSANISILLLIVIGTLAVYSMYNIGSKTLLYGTPALMSLTSEYASFIFTTIVQMISIYLSVRADKCITTKDRPRGVSFEKNYNKFGRLIFCSNLISHFDYATFVKEGLRKINFT